MPLPEIELIQSLLETTDDAARQKILEEKSDMVNDQLLAAINAIITEGEARKQSPELVESLRSVYKLALRFNMEKNLKK